MKIALLLYGQPRFFQYTYKYILQEYTIKNCETHIFAHFWKDIGYGPNDDEQKKYYHIDSIQNYLEKINTKKYLIEDYTDLDKALIYIKEQINKDHNRYKIGQHLSMEKCFNLIEQYQSEHNIKYDIVIKVRTDIFYSNSKFYNTKIEYENVKYNNYIAPFKHFLPGTKNIIVPEFQVFKIPEELLNNEYYHKQIQEISQSAKLKFGKPIKEHEQSFPLKEKKILEKFDRVLDLLIKIKPTEIYKHKHVWVAIGTDIYSIADFKSAKIIYNNWVQKYINLYKEYDHIDVYKHLLRRVHSAFNFLLLKEKVNIHGTLCTERYRRLVYSKSCKEKFVLNPKKRAIIIDDFNQLNDEYIFNFKTLPSKK